MGERGAGELPRGDFRLQAGLNVGEIGGVSPDAAKSLAAFRDRVLPQSALERARGVIEGQAKVRESGRGGRRGTGIERAAPAAREDPDPFDHRYQRVGDENRV